MVANIFVWAWNLWSVHHVDGWVWLQILGGVQIQCVFVFFFWRITSTNSCKGRMRWFRTAFGDSAALRHKTNLWVVNLRVNKHVSKRSPKSKQNLISSKKPSPLQCVQFQSNHPFQWNHTWSHDPCPQGVGVGLQDVRVTQGWPMRMMSCWSLAPEGHTISNFLWSRYPFFQF